MAEESNELPLEDQEQVEGDEENPDLKNPEEAGQEKAEEEEEKCCPHPITDPEQVKEVMKPDHNLQVDDEGTIWFCPPKGDYDPPRPGCFEDKPAKIPRYQQPKTKSG